jgi:glyoxylase-like metal-dependent hydrolase (beta-lactamase superfamily II)
MSTASITGLDCGWMRTQARTLSSDGTTDEISIPIPAWLVRHERGIVVFDVGLHPDLATSTESLGPLAKMFTVDLEPGGTVGPRLAEHDVDPHGSFTVVLSHGHFDHVGGLVELPNARVLVQRDEWRSVLDGSDRPLVDHGHDVVELAGEHDVFGDGAIVCVPTPGHTCGHQSLRIATVDGPVILTGDACYFSRTLDDEVLPPFAYDRDQQLASLRRLRQERGRGVSIVPGHDAVVFGSMTRRV